MAAVLSCGPPALASHRWALWLYGLQRHPPHGLVDITASGAHGRADVRLHRARTARPDRTQGIPCTSPVRTLLDCAPLLSETQLRRAVNQAQIDRLVTAEGLRTALARANGHATRRLLDLVPLDQHGATRSALEDRFLDLCRQEHWDLPLLNEVIDGIECDAVFASRRLILQADGWRYHGTWIAFEDDADIRLTLAAAGWRPVPLTFRMLTRDWPRTRARLRDLIR